MIKLGSGTMQKAYIGANEVLKMYLGSTLVYTKEQQQSQYYGSADYESLPDGYSGEDEVFSGSSIATWQKIVFPSAQNGRIDEVSVKLREIDRAWTEVQFVLASHDAVNDLPSTIVWTSGRFTDATIVNDLASKTIAANYQLSGQTEIWVGILQEGNPQSLTQVAYNNTAGGTPKMVVLQLAGASLYEAVTAGNVGKVFSTYLYAGSEVSYNDRYAQVQVKVT